MNTVCHATPIFIGMGDPAYKLFFIKRGQVKSSKTTVDGKEYILNLFQDGDLFGGLDPFEKSVHQCNAVTMEDSEVGIILRKDLEILLWQHGDVALDLMKWIGTMHRITQTKFKDVMMFGKPGALCSTLIRLSHSYGDKIDARSYRIRKKMTHKELADMIGATRESVNRMLRDLRRKTSSQWKTDT